MISLGQVDTAQLPRDHTQILRDWIVTFATDFSGFPQTRRLTLARLVSADSGWIKFRLATGELVMFVSRNVLSAEQASQ